MRTEERFGKRSDDISEKEVPSTVIKILSKSSYLQLNFNQQNIFGKIFEILINENMKVYVAYLHYLTFYVICINSKAISFPLWIHYLFVPLYCCILSIKEYITKLTINLLLNRLV